MCPALSLYYFSPSLPSPPYSSHFFFFLLFFWDIFSAAGVVCRVLLTENLNKVQFYWMINFSKSSFQIGNEVGACKMNNGDIPCSRVYGKYINFNFVRFGKYAGDLPFIQHESYACFVFIQMCSVFMENQNLLDITFSTSGHVVTFSIFDKKSGKVQPSG